MKKKEWVLLLNKKKSININITYYLLLLSIDLVLFLVSQTEYNKIKQSQKINYNHHFNIMKKG